MSPELKQKWVDALRSGGYAQGVDWLKYHNKETVRYEYCCLGVLLEISNSKTCIPICRKSGMPSESQCRRLGIPYGDPHNVGNKAPNNITEKLACMNDEGKSFKKIANYIEKHL